MRRLVVAALAAIAVLFGGSVALIALVTEPGAPRSGGTRSVAPDEAPPAPEPAAPAPPPPAYVMPSPAAPPPPRTPEPEPAPPPPLVPDGARPDVDLSGSVLALEGLVTRRCGQLSLSAPREMPGTGGTDAVLLVELRASAGRLSIANAWPARPGRLRPALLACARMALRGQRLDAPAPGTGPYRAALVVSMPPGVTTEPDLGAEPEPGEDVLPE